MPGTVLLLAASPTGKGCLVDAASVLPVLAAVPPAILSGTDTANVVELADPLEPQAVLTRLRAAAAAPGPLTVFVTGQLQLDRRQRLPHLALARTCGCGRPGRPRSSWTCTPTTRPGSCCAAPRWTPGATTRSTGGSLRRRPAGRSLRLRT
jgi:hypothetical protein